MSPNNNELIQRYLEHPIDKREFNNGKVSINLAD
jgi:hypothetical protein